MNLCDITWLYPQGYISSLSHLTSIDVHLYVLEIYVQLLMYLAIDYTSNKLLGAACVYAD